MKLISKNFLIIILFMFVSNAYASELTPKQVGQYMSAAAGVLATQKTLAGIDNACKKATPGILNVWESHNKAAIQKAEKLRAIAFKVVEKHEGIDTVNKLKKKQDNFLNQKVSTFVNKIEALSDDKKNQTCKKFKQEIAQGKLDIKNNAGLYNFLMSQ